MPTTRASSAFWSVSPYTGPEAPSIPPALAMKSGAQRMPRPGHFRVVAFGLQLVVGDAAHGLRAQPADGSVVEDRAERARREDVDLLVVDRGRIRHRGLELRRGLLGAPGVHVGHHEPRAPPLQPFAETHADLPHSLHRYPDAIEAGAAERLRRGRANCLQRPEGREGGAIGSLRKLARDREHVGALLLHDFRVGRSHADVDRRPVGSAEPPQMASHGPQAVVLVGRRRVADHHHLAAAERQAGGGVLVGHRVGEPQRVAERLLLRHVGLHAAAAGRRSEARAVDRDDRGDAEFGIAAEDHILGGRGTPDVRERPSSNSPPGLAPRERPRVAPDSSRNGRLAGGGRTPGSADVRPAARPRGPVEGVEDALHRRALGEVHRCGGLARDLGSGTPAPRGSSGR